ncbi:hypothetical protein ACFVUN_12960 [Kitasatospora griseola]|uniref:hypothetical protein n=1 Tax=Kitasatospora griseola TaxID=2064 RepID=UPI0036DA50DC
MAGTNRCPVQVFERSTGTMALKSTEHPHRFWAWYTAPALFGSLALSWLAVWQFGAANPVAWVVICLLGVALTGLVGNAYRTQATSSAALLVLVLFAGIGFFGSGAVSGTVLSTDGKRTVAQITAVHPRNGKAAGYCLLRTAEGQDIAKRLSPCEGRDVGNQLEVTYDPAGRQYPTENLPDPGGAVRWTGGLVAVLVLLVLSMPLWGPRGPRVRERQR